MADTFQFFHVKQVHLDWRTKIFMTLVCSSVEKSEGLGVLSIPKCFQVRILVRRRELCARQKAGWPDSAKLIYQKF